MSISLSLEEVRQEMEDFSGFCTKCNEITADECEPDARKYKCPVCGTNNVYGIEECIFMGLIEVI